MYPCVYVEWLSSGHFTCGFMFLQEYLGEVCITDGCHGVIKAIKHYEGMGRPKIIAQVDKPVNYVFCS